MPLMERGLSSFTSDESKYIYQRREVVIGLQDGAAARLGDGGRSGVVGAITISATWPQPPPAGWQHQGTCLADKAITPHNVYSVRTVIIPFETRDSTGNSKG